MEGKERGMGISYGEQGVEGGDDLETRLTSKGRKLVKSQALNCTIYRLHPSQFGAT